MRMPQRSLYRGSMLILLSAIATLAALLIGIVAPLRTEAHQGSSVACGVNYTPALKYSSWGCGWGTRLTHTPQTFSYNIGDRRHDHSCVYLWYVADGGSWGSTGRSSCVTGGASSGSFTDPGGKEILGTRIYRFSPYGNNYLTLSIYL